jgi:hypothetical protein
MNLDPVFRNLGTWIYLVREEVGELDYDTGLRPKIYSYERVRALIGQKNFGFQLHLNLDESMVALTKQADLVVQDQEAYRLEELSSAFGVYIYKKNKVTGDELRSIVDGIASKSSHETFS